ncbi:MAG: hypothetical protein ACI9XZ_000021 [Alphaproteobacteria bacterium]|jgi:hypothetical protein
MLHWLSRNWRQSLFLLVPICVAYGALLALEGVAISWIDRWLPVSTFEAATWSVLFVTAAATWLRFCLVGLGVYLIIRRAAPTDRIGWQFGTAWAIGSAAVVLAVLALELSQHRMQYGGHSFSGEAVRYILLLFIYAKILLVYPGIRLLLGAASVVDDGSSQGLLSAWNATSFVESARLLFLLIVLKLVIENVFVNVLSFMPFVAPFWFVADELSRVRFFVGQGTRIVAESLGVMFYVAFFVALGQSRTRDET